MTSQPWRGFRADPRTADLAFTWFLGLAVAVLVLVRPGGWPTWTACLAAAAVFLAFPALRTAALGPVVRRFPRVARHARSWYPILAVPILYMVVPILNRALHSGRYFDDVVLGWEQALFGGQPSHSWAPAIPWLPVSELLHAAYLAYYLLFFLPAMLLHIRGERRAFELAMGTLAVVATVHLAAYVGFPVQGPRYLFEAPTGGGMENGLMYRLTHVILEGGSSRGAAFPSAHAAIAVAQCVIAWRWLPRWAPWITGTTVLLVIATVYGGFHYLVDSLVGAMLGGGIAVWMTRRNTGESAGRDVHIPLRLRTGAPPATGGPHEG